MFKFRKKVLKLTLYLLSGSVIFSDFMYAFANFPNTSSLIKSSPTKKSSISKTDFKFNKPQIIITTVSGWFLALLIIIYFKVLKPKNNHINVTIPPSLGEIDNIISQVQIKSWKDVSLNQVYVKSWEEVSEVWLCVYFNNTKKLKFSEAQEALADFCRCRAHSNPNFWQIAHDMYAKTSQLYKNQSKNIKDIYSAKSAEAEAKSKECAAYKCALYNDGSGSWEEAEKYWEKVINTKPSYVATAKAKMCECRARKTNSKLDWEAAAKAWKAVPADTELKNTFGPIYHPAYCCFADANALTCEFLSGNVTDWDSVSKAWEKTAIADKKISDANIKSGDGVNLLTGFAAEAKIMMDRESCLRYYMWHQNL